MNYITHLNAVFQRFSLDSRLKTTHISLYMALFQRWNFHRFKSIFFIERRELMNLAKIKSKSSYHRCINQLHDWNYIYYIPSHNPYKGSRIKMLEFRIREKSLVKSQPRETVIGTANSAKKEYTTVPRTGQLPHINRNKSNINPIGYNRPKKRQVIEFFKKKKWAELEAEKFYNHYSSIGWKMGGKIDIVNWHAAAENWILKGREFKKNKQKKGGSQKWENLKIEKNKNYDEPL